MNRVIARLDVSSSIGFGHLSRVKVLFELLNEFNLLIVTGIESNIKMLFCPEDNINVLVCVDEMEWINSIRDDDIVLVDSYIFDRRLFRLMRGKCKKLVYIDDLCDGFYDVDILVNHSGYFTKSDYLISDGTSLYLGLTYALINSIFLSVPRQIDSVKTICFCQGASNVSLLTKKILDDILNISSVLNIVCISLENPDVQNSKLSYTGKITEQEVCNLFKSSDLIITPTSTMIIQALATNALVVPYYFVDNQRGVYRSYSTACKNMGIGNILYYEKNILNRCLDQFVFPVKVNNNYISSNISTLIYSIND